jgi:hypothetical protein
MDKYFTSRDYYRRPYRIPLPEGKIHIDPYRLYNNDVSEGSVTEYIAYRQGLPVTRRLVWDYYIDMELEGEPGDTISLGNVFFSCENGTYDTKFDLSTLGRHFELIGDMVDDKSFVFDKDTSGNITIPLPYNMIDVRAALAILCWRSSDDFQPMPYRCLRFLRPKDTAYYMRYAWVTGDGGLMTMDGELTRSETVEFLTKIVAAGLDGDTRLYLSKYNRLTMSNTLGPLVMHIMKDYPVCYKLLEWLLVDKPSVRLYLLCEGGSSSTELILEATKKLDDNAEGLDDKDWECVQSYLYGIILAIKTEEEYLRVMTLLGWDEYFPRLEFEHPHLDRYYGTNKISKLTLCTLSWMDAKMKNCVRLADSEISRYPL